MSVTFDTGSDWLILQSTYCGSCYGDDWDSEESTTYETNSETKTLSYGSASVDGIIATDQFSFDEN